MGAGSILTTAIRRFVQHQQSISGAECLCWSRTVLWPITHPSPPPTRSTLFAAHHDKYCPDKTVDCVVRTITAQVLINPRYCFPTTLEMYCFSVLFRIFRTAPYLSLPSTLSSVVDSFYDCFIVQIKYLQTSANLFV